MRHVPALMLFGLLSGCGATVIRADTPPPGADGGALPPGTDVPPSPTDASPPPAEDAGPSPAEDVAPSPDAGPAGPWDPREELRRLREAMTGTWEGTAEAPGTWLPPRWTVRVSFRADGRYEAVCTSRNCTEPFYYGPPCEGDPRCRWSLDDVRANGDVLGSLSIVFDTSDVVRDGELLRVRYDGELRFEFWNVWSGGRAGPVRYTLRRVR